MLFLSLKQINVNIRVNETDSCVSKHYALNELTKDNFIEYAVMYSINSRLHKQAYYKTVVHNNPDLNCI